MSRRIEVVLTCKSQHLADVMPLGPEPSPATAVDDASLLVCHHLGELNDMLIDEQNEKIQQQAQWLYGVRYQEYLNSIQRKNERVTCDGHILRVVEVFPDSVYTDAQLKILATLDAVLTMNNYYCNVQMGEFNTTLYGAEHRAELVLYARADKVYRKDDNTGDYYILVGDRLRFIAGDVARGEVDGDEIQSEYQVTVVDQESGTYKIEGSMGGELTDDDETLDSELADEDSQLPYDKLILWFKNGMLERGDDLPAREDRYAKMWFHGNRCHRDNGPAIVYSNGDTVCCRDGVEVDQ